MIELTAQPVQLTDLQLAFLALTNKKWLYDKYFAYYEGHQPLVYSADRLREIFKDFNARFTQNWCAVVVDSCLERIQLRGFTVANNKGMETALGTLIEENELTLEADDVHLAALVTGESFVIVWPDEETRQPQAFYNDPRNCHAFYYADNPRKMRFAAKWWLGDNGYMYLNLYYEDKIEYYVTRSILQGDGVIQGADSFIPTEEGSAENPYGIVPVFHFRRERRAIHSELKNVVEPQDAINKLLADMMIAAEFGAFPQRWAITDNNISNLKNAPNEIWKLLPSEDGAQNTQLGEFSTANLQGYLDAIANYATSIGIITRTPKHYFFTQGGDPSGESLIAMEGPLNKKCQKYIDRFAVTWRAVANFLLLVKGSQVDALTVAATFDRPETVQPMTESTIRAQDVKSGIPLVTTLRDAGWTEAEIAAMEKDRQAEQQAQNDNLAAAMLNAQANFDRGQTPANGQGIANGSPVDRQGDRLWPK